MMSILQKAIIFLSVISILFANQAQAYCSRCVKIENERAKEQAAHPQPWRYYDDQISLHEKNGSSSQSGRDKDGDSSGVGSGALSGSTYHSSTESNKSSKSTEADQSSNPSKTPSNSEQLSADEGARNHDFLAENDESLEKNENSLSSKKDSNRDDSSPSTKTYSTIFTIFRTKNLLETLDGSFTLFIPTNEALQQLPPRTLIELTLPENEEKLAALVSNHLVAQKLLKQDFTNNTGVKAISGRNLSLENKNGKLFINNIEILRAEAAGYDGVIYIIDKVLVP